MNLAPLKIGIIDDAVELDKLHNLVPYFNSHISIVQLNKIQSSKPKEQKRLIPLNHGTLYTAILIEALQMKKILDKVHITNVILTDKFGENSLNNIINSGLSIAQSERVGMILGNRKIQYQLLS